MNKVKCEFCNGSGAEPGKAGCVWCCNTGTKEGQQLFEPPAPAACEHQWRGLEGGNAQCDKCWAIKSADGIVSEPANELILPVGEQRQGEPVALTERKRVPSARATTWNARIEGFNECLDEIAKLGPLYTGPDSGEVERLRDRLKIVIEFRDKFEAMSEKLDSENDDLRAQLAERDALFGKYGDTLRPFVELMRKELEANSHKGDRDGWLGMTQLTAMGEIEHHVRKLNNARMDERSEEVQEHAADVANCCMMLLDVCGLLMPKCCEPTPEELKLLAGGDYRPEELWGGSRPTCPKCIGDKQGAPDMDTCEPIKGSGSLEFDRLLAEYHAIVWASGEDGDVDYDLAGIDTAKKLQALHRAALERKS